MGLCLNRISSRLLCLILFSVLWAQFNSIPREIAAELLTRLRLQEPIYNIYNVQMARARALYIENQFHFNFSSFIAVFFFVVVVVLFCFFFYFSRHLR